MQRQNEEYNGQGRKEAKKVKSLLKKIMKILTTAKASHCSAISSMGHYVQDELWLKYIHKLTRGFVWSNYLSEHSETNFSLNNNF